MSDTLEERLSRHSDAFQGLLSLIPAKYYYNDESETQWNKKKTSKSDKRRAKKAKLDPESSTTAADEAQRRSEQSKIDESDSDSDISVIYDDHGNEIRLRSEGSESEDKSVESEQEPVTVSDAVKSKSTSSETSNSSLMKPPAKLEAAQPRNGKKQRAVAKQANAREAAAKSEKENPESTGDSAETISATDPLEPSSDSQIKSAEEEEKERAKAARLQELRQKINEMREKRRAPGTNTPGAPRSREELLALRKQRLEQRKLKRRRESKEQPEPMEIDIDDNEAKKEAEMDDVMFGTVKFKDGTKIDKRLDLAKDKKVKKRNAIDQLKVIESRKEKIAQLDEAKRAEIEEKAQWSKMILQSEGAKVKDDEKLLKKAVKQKRNKKLKSELEWNERKRKVSEGIAARDAKRAQNIANHTVIKHAKGKNQKKKLRQRAGFEGKKHRRKN